MSAPLSPPSRKNPLARTRLPLLPPKTRSRRAHDLTRAAAEGRFAVQRCTACGAFLYPARDACPECLSSAIEVADVPPRGELLSRSAAAVPADNYFRERAPWPVGLVRLDCGPIVLAHLHGDCPAAGPVRLSLQLDRAGQAVFFARPREDTPHMTDDPQWRELTASPKGRRILITDGRNPLALPLAQRLQAAGARAVFVGLADGWKPLVGRGALEAAGAQIVPLDVTDERSVADLAADLGGKVEILINTGDHLRPGRLGQASIGHARDTMEQVLFGMMRLATGFGPAIAGRAADGLYPAAAWVNVLSVMAEASHPGFAAYSAAQAAALSLSRSLRAELGRSGVRVITVLVGPTDTEWYQALPPPKLPLSTVAGGVVDALERGQEDVLVGDVARDLHARFWANPKALERELAQ